MFLCYCISTLYSYNIYEILSDLLTKINVWQHEDSVVNAPSVSVILKLYFLDYKLVDNNTKTALQILQVKIQKPPS